MPTERLNSNTLRRFQTLFNELTRDNLHLLDEVYSTDLIFEDPFGCIQGLQDYRSYLAKMYEGVRYCHFEFEDTFIHSDRAMLVWKMETEHSRLNWGRRFGLKGCSYLIGTDKIHTHRDFFDSNELILENIPGIRIIPRLIKRMV